MCIEKRSKTVFFKFLVLFLLCDQAYSQQGEDDILLMVIPAIAAAANNLNPGKPPKPNACPGGVYGHHGMPCVDTTKEMKPRPGRSIFDVVDQFQPIYPSDPPNHGAFRLPCGVSHMSNNDPLVFPNQQGASHHHTFFGNVDADHNSTADSIKNSGNSTCDGAIANRSAYWVPSMIDTASHAPIRPLEILVYYKTERADRVNHLPVGLRMIAKPSEADQSITDHKTDFVCRDFAQNNEFARASNRIPSCAKGNVIVYSLDFPNCWDGQNLDSANHTSHMKYSNWTAVCPPSHPVRIPTITFNVVYKVGNGGTSKWRLASDKKGKVPGSTIHGDWMNGWDEGISNTFVDHCLKASLDCNTWSLGDGRALGVNDDR